MVKSVTSWLWIQSCSCPRDGSAGSFAARLAMTRDSGGANATAPLKYFWSSARLASDLSGGVMSVVDGCSMDFGLWHAHLARDPGAGRAPQRGCPAGDPARPCH